MLGDGGFVEMSFWQQLEFFLPVVLTAAGLGVACSATGVFVLLRREAMMALTLPQAVVIGASAAMLAHSDERLGYAFYALAAALPLLAWTRHRRLDHLLPAIYVAGMCVPFLVIASHGEEHLGELQKLFIGNTDVAITLEDARRTLPIVLGAGAVMTLLWRRWLLLAQAPATAQLGSLHPAWWDLVFLALTGIIVLMGTTAMGVVMVLALLFLPAAAALPWGRRIPATLAIACFVGLIDVVLAFYLSNRWNWPYSQTVGGVGFVVMLLSRSGAWLAGR